MEQPFWKKGWRQMKHTSIPDPAVQLLDPGNMKTCVHKKTSTRILIPASFKNWKQPRYAMIERWISKLQNVHKMEYVSAGKINRLLTCTKWVNLKINMLSKRSLYRGVQSILPTFMRGWKLHSEMLEGADEIRLQKDSIHMKFHNRQN